MECAVDEEVVAGTEPERHAGDEAGVAVGERLAARITAKLLQGHGQAAFLDFHTAALAVAIELVAVIAGDLHALAARDELEHQRHGAR
jgi:hypothetical protein